MWIYELTCERPTLRLVTSLMISFSFGSFLFAEMAGTVEKGRQQLVCLVRRLI